MDLEEFENTEGEPDVSTPHSFSAAEGLRYLDAQWYAQANRRARWMDLIGDYAGNEPFVLDGAYIMTSYMRSKDVNGRDTGDALIQLVLDDKLLALARSEGQSWSSDNHQ